MSKFVYLWNEKCTSLVSRCRWLYDINNVVPFVPQAILLFRPLKLSNSAESHCTDQDFTIFECNNNTREKFIFIRKNHVCTNGNFFFFNFFFFSNFFFFKKIFFYFFLFFFICFFLDGNVFFFSAICFLRSSFAFSTSSFRLCLYL